MTKNAQTNLTAHFQATLSRFIKPNTQLVLALSGGLDSIVLLHLLNQARQIIPFHLNAMHVHHGLSQHADAWAEFCLKQCALLNVPIEVAHVTVAKNPKEGIEAAARNLRYQALLNHQPNGISPHFIVTAHHQGDQAETLLLQLFRGAGVKGLASMAACDEHQRLLRPLLAISRDALLAYATQHDLMWCEDESNRNVDFDRNFVRHAVLPLIQTRYSAIQPTLARTAAHLAEANHLLDDLAAMDAQPLLTKNSLCLQGLGHLDTPRAKNMLRWWLANHQLNMPNTAFLTEILHQLLHAKQDANINIELSNFSLKRYQQRAYLVLAQVPQPFDLTWQGESELSLPNGGKLLFRQEMGVGISLKQVTKPLRIKNRTGGEQLKPQLNRPSRTLKYLLQEASIPPWQRDFIPLIYCQDTLVYVPSIGASSQLLANADEVGLEIIWQAPVIV
ncbi:MAG: tRNA lysidine(34) synthetase TilS [Methylophilaceae bacterium]